MRWNDSRLTWDPQEFGGLEEVWMKSDIYNEERSWTPDVIMF